LLLADGTRARCGSSGEAATATREIPKKGHSGMSENAMKIVNEAGHLVVGGCDVVELAARHGTPMYLLDEEVVRDRCRQYHREFEARYPQVEVAYAGKALLTVAICRVMEQEGMGLDVASEGELYTALEAGFPPGRIKLHGNFKSESEMRRALDAGVGRIVVDSLIELEHLNAIAQEMGTHADILIRVRPGVDTHTQEKIQTGQVDSKFGLGIYSGEAEKGVQRALELPRLRLRGIHCHIGSQLLDVVGFERAIDLMLEFLAELRDRDGFVAEDLDLGGGLGARYTEDDDPPSIAELAEAMCSTLQENLSDYALPEPRLILEPGRSIVGEAGVTVYTVGVVKEIPGIRTYVSVDGGLSDNPRPALYGAVYEAIVANKADQEATQWVRVAGKHCETDTLIDDTLVQPVEAGDLLAVFCTGAYNYAMASNYNQFLRPPVILCSGGADHVIVARETLEDLVRHDVIPEHLR